MDIFFGQYFLVGSDVIFQSKSFAVWIWSGNWACSVNTACSISKALTLKEFILFLLWFKIVLCMNHIFALFKGTCLKFHLLNIICVCTRAKQIMVAQFPQQCCGNWACCIKRVYPPVYTIHSMLTKVRGGDIVFYMSEKGANINL